MPGMNQANHATTTVAILKKPISITPYAPATFLLDENSIYEGYNDHQRCALVPADNTPGDETAHGLGLSVWG